MNYTLRDIFQAMDHRWLSEDEFYYPLDPNKHYSEGVVQTMIHEWSYRTREVETLLVDSRICNLHIPRWLAITMPQNTPQKLERALFHFS